MENTSTSTYPKSPQVQTGVWTVGAKGGLYTGLILFIFHNSFDHFCFYKKTDPELEF